MGSSGPGRVRVERGICRQPNGKYAVCCRDAGRLHFRTVGSNLAEARGERLEHDERPRPQRRRQRVLGRNEIERLLGACAPRDRLMIATVLYTGLRIQRCSA